MNHLAQIITNLFNSISIKLVVATVSVLLLLSAWKDKISTVFKAYKKRKGIREIEKQVWWIE